MGQITETVDLTHDTRSFFEPSTQPLNQAVGALLRSMSDGSPQFVPMESMEPQFVPMESVEVSRLEKSSDTSHRKPPPGRQGGNQGSDDDSVQRLISRHRLHSGKDDSKQKAGVSVTAQVGVDHALTASTTASTPEGKVPTVSFSGVGTRGPEAGTNLTTIAAAAQTKPAPISNNEDLAMLARVQARFHTMPRADIQLMLHLFRSYLLEADEDSLPLDKQTPTTELRLPAEDMPGFANICTPFPHLDGDLLRFEAIEALIGSFRLSQAQDDLSLPSGNEPKPPTSTTKPATPSRKGGMARTSTFGLDIRRGSRESMSR